MTEAPLDRYEFTDSKFTMELARWPAYLIIHNATIFTSTPGTSVPAYVTFFTEGNALTLPSSPKVTHADASAALGITVEEVK